MSPSVLRALPGIPSTAQCKDGVDGIALDSTNNTLIVPDSPTGNVYRMSLDGRKLTLLTSGITRPVGAAVDAHGTVYITDECGGALWRVTQSGKAERIGNFGMLDDVVVDTHGNAFVTDLKINIHALIKINLVTGKRQILAQRGFIEPQGLAIDGQGNLYLSDDYANVIVKYTSV
jgi:sugar lactone lactonase YvrE